MAGYSGIGSRGLRRRQPAPFFLSAVWLSEGRTADAIDDDVGCAKRGIRGEDELLSSGPSNGIRRACHGGAGGAGERIDARDAAGSCIAVTAVLRVIRVMTAVRVQRSGLCPRKVGDRTIARAHHDAETVLARAEHEAGRHERARNHQRQQPQDPAMLMTGLHGDEDYRNLPRPW